MRDDTLEERARTLRRTVTISERKLWTALRRPPLDALHFRRQVAFDDRYIADFASHRGKLIVVDRPSHDLTVTDDIVRTEWLAASRQSRAVVGRVRCRSAPSRRPARRESANC